MPFFDKFFSTKSISFLSGEDVEGAIQALRDQGINASEPKRVQDVAYIEVPKENYYKAVQIVNRFCSKKG